jgi:pre-mRNA-processing factor 6
MASGRKDFLSQQAPENYVAGLGRGATGFTTRSDLGPAREGPTPEQIQAALTKRAAQLGAAAPTAYGNNSREKGGKDEKEDEGDDERFQDPDNEVGLFAYGQFDQEDDEADRIYQEVDEKMDKRRKARRLVLSFPLLPPIPLCPVNILFIGPVLYLDRLPTIFARHQQGSSRAERTRGL